MMRRNILPAVIKILPRPAVVKGIANRVSALTISAASLSSVSGGSSGDGNDTKNESAGSNPSAKVIPVEATPATSGRFSQVGQNPLVANFEVNSGRSGNGQIRRPKWSWSQGAGSRLKSSTSEASENRKDVVTVGFGIGSDEEATNKFTRFAQEIGACSVEGLLAGAEQAYYSTAVLIGLLASHTKPAVTASSLHEGEEEDEAAPSLMNADEMRALIRKELLPESDKDGKSFVAEPLNAETHEKRNLVTSDASTEKEKVVSTITSVLPVSHILAETIYNAWTLQNDGRGNLFSIAAPSDYVLGVKLLAFLNLHASSSSPSSSSQNSKDRGTVEGRGEMSESRTIASEEAYAPQKEKNDEALSVGPDHLNDKKLHIGQADNKPTMTHPLSAADPQISHSAPNTLTRQENLIRSHKGYDNLSIAIKKRLSYFHSKRKGASVYAESPLSKDLTFERSEVELNSPPKSVTICVNGNKFSNIPSTARACVLLTLDTVVPPGRYTSNYDWYYKRIVGFRSESERIMVARVFSQNSPTLLVSFFDFLKRMFVGRQLEFVLNRGICEKLGIPEDAFKYTPAMQKLMCMYMDSSKRWILADLIPLSPINTETAVEE